ncbi:hypothetical protein DFS34DRAFT_659149 [Phlyctochytrium arcticum]|nr:hypothetical protein DFS34DRAFT_659149 [Phlyctochytrium arcticum]
MSGGPSFNEKLFFDLQGHNGSTKGHGEEFVREEETDLGIGTIPSEHESRMPLRSDSPSRFSEQAKLPDAQVVCGKEQDLTLDIPILDKFQRDWAGGQGEPDSCRRSQLVLIGLGDPTSLQHPILDLDLADGIGNTRTVSVVASEANDQAEELLTSPITKSDKSTVPLREKTEITGPVGGSASKLLAHLGIGQKGPGKSNGSVPMTFAKFKAGNFSDARSRSLNLPRTFDPKSTPNPVGSMDDFSSHRWSSKVTPVQKISSDNSELLQFHDTWSSAVKTESPSDLYPINPCEREIIWEPPSPAEIDQVWSEYSQCREPAYWPRNDDCDANFELDQLSLELSDPPHPETWGMPDANAWGIEQMIPLESQSFSPSWISTDLYSMSDSYAGATHSKSGVDAFTYRPYRLH